MLKQRTMFFLKAGEVGAFGCLGLLAVPGPALVVAQTTRFVVPATASARGTASVALELRVAEAFNRGDYGLALPLLQKLANSLGGQTDRLGLVEEQMRICRKNMGQASRPNPASATQPDVATGDSRKPLAAPKDGQVVVLDITELGNFDYDARTGGKIPSDVRRLSGVKVRTHGYMVPMDQAENITQFALVPGLCACMFCQSPQIQHTIVVRCHKGKAVSYFQEEITVEGTLNVDEKKDDGYIVSVFEMEAVSVRPVGR